MRDRPRSQQYDKASRGPYETQQLLNAANELNVSIEFLAERLGIQTHSTCAIESEQIQDSRQSFLMPPSGLYGHAEVSAPLNSQVTSGSRVQHEFLDPITDWSVVPETNVFRELDQSTPLSTLHSEHPSNTSRSMGSVTYLGERALEEEYNTPTIMDSDPYQEDLTIGKTSFGSTEELWETSDDITTTASEVPSQFESQPLTASMSHQSSMSGSSWEEISSISSTESSWVVTTPTIDRGRSFVGRESEAHLSVTFAEEAAFREMSPVLGPCSRVWVVPPRTRKSRGRKAPSQMKTRFRGRSEISQDHPQRRGPFKDDKTRQFTALTRRLKGCIRCRMQRIRCDLDLEDPRGPCLTCRRISTPILCKLPCLRWIITDSSLYREQDRPYQLFSTRWQNMDLVDITTWASERIETIELSQIFIDAPYTVQVREFVPLEGDKLYETWLSGGRVKHHSLPRYALADMNATAKMFEKWIDCNVHNYISTTLDKVDKLVWDTYFFAFKYIGKAKTLREQTLLAECFRFWVGCRKTSHPEHIFGHNTLGGELVDDQNSPFHNVIPMPVVMIAQMECIMYTKVLRPKSQRILKILTELIMENKTENWLTIYLTLFILLNSCSLITKRDYETARQYNMRTDYANPDSIKGHHSGSLTMLAHFHYLNKGVQPFHLAHDEAGARDVARAADLTTEELEFVRQTSKTIQEEKRVALMKGVRENLNFGHPLYWVSQLYDANWTPGPTA